MTPPERAGQRIATGIIEHGWNASFDAETLARAYLDLVEREGRLEKRLAAYEPDYCASCDGPCRDESPIPESQEAE